MKNVAFLSTVFPMNRCYLFDFLDSLKNQSYRNFDIIIVNDGFGGFEEFINVYSDYLNIVELRYSDTIAKNRVYGINYCIEKKYDILIFGDSDDYFSENRIEKSVELLDIYDVVVNDLSLFAKSGMLEEKYFSHRLKNLSSVDFEFIKNKNIFGLTNTSINLNKIDKINIPANLVAVDWFLFSILLLKGRTAVYTNDTVTYYRQHQSNFIGMKSLSSSAVEKIHQVRKRHYEALLECKELKGFDENLAEIINQLDSSDFNKEIKYPLWWEIA